MSDFEKLVYCDQLEVEVDQFTWSSVLDIDGVVFQEKIIKTWGS